MVKVSSNFHQWKTNTNGKRMDHDISTRISLVIDLYKALNIYFGKPWADRWVTLEIRGPLFPRSASNPIHAPIGTPGMMDVTCWIPALVGINPTALRYTTQFAKGIGGKSHEGCGSGIFT